MVNTTGGNVTTGQEQTVAVLSARVRERIESGRRMRQSELARALDLHPSHVCLIFAGKRKPSLDVAAGLAKRLRVSLDDLYAYLVMARPQGSTLTVN
jgi:DNA-binding XRE family transcriptional regulator